MTDRRSATEIVDEFWERRERGERVDADELVRRHPEMADELRERFEALDRLAREFPPRGTAAPGEELVGERLGPYRLARVLGAGGMGTVFLAEAEGRVAGLAEGQRVAVKLVHPHLLDREGFFKRFLREAEVGRRVRHENVVRTLDADAIPWRGGHAHFLVMEYVEGQTLRQFAEEVGRVPEELCRRIGRDVARALAAIHAEGAVHRDVKPDNVLLTKDHVVKVMDLGVASVGDAALRVSQTGAFVGSVRYAAPEQFKGGDAALDGRADLYALGLVLYEIATGAHPFPGDDFHVVLKRQLTENPRPAGEINPQLSAFFEEVMRTLLAKEPERRFASAAALLDVLTAGEKSKWWHDRSAEVRAETRRPLRRIRIPRETAVYGRDAELAKLRALYDRASAGEGQVILVEGEAGIGKTRLVDEFVSRLVQSGEDLNFLFGGNDPGGAATVSGAFATAYREHFGTESLEASLADYLEETPVLVPAFAALLRGEPPPDGRERLTKDSMQTVFVHATRRLAAERPTIVLVDDLHFAPEEGRALFASLALAVPGHRVLLVGTARPGVPESWTANIERLHHATRMPLARLSPKDLARLLVDAFRSERLAEELSFKIAAKSDGNPYFVFELLRGLREGQFIRQRPDGTWVTTQVIRDIEVPSTVKDLIGARVADLDPEDKDLLDMASCLGFEFDAAVVAGALGVPHVAVLRRLARIEARHRLVRCAGERFVFDHHQVQETLYAALPPPLARAYHASIGAAIETACGGPSADPKSLAATAAAQLAEHFLSGGQGERARRYFDAAMDGLEKEWRIEAAVRLTQRALTDPAFRDDAVRGPVLVRHANNLDHLSRRTERRATLDEAVAVAERVPGAKAVLARAKVYLGVALQQASKYSEAERVLLAALDAAHEAGDSRTESDALGTLASVRMLSDDYVGAAEYGERHMKIVKEKGDLNGESNAAGTQGVVAFRTGRFAEAETWFRRRLEICAKIGQLRGQAIAMGNLGYLLTDMGRLEEAEPWLSKALEIDQEIGYRFGEVIVRGNLGLILIRTGRIVEAQAAQERVLALATEVGDRPGESRTLGNLGTISFHQGRIVEAESRMRGGIAIAREIGYRFGLVIQLVDLARVHATLGDAAAANAELEEALRMSREWRLKVGEGAAMQVLAEVARQQGDFAAAERICEEALPVQRANAHSEVLACTLLTIGATATAQGRPDVARQALVECEEVARRANSPGPMTCALAELSLLDPSFATAAARRLDGLAPRIVLADAMRARFVLWRASRDPSQLADARRILDHLVAHAPVSARESMLANVPLHRDIAAAAREHLGS